MAIHVVLNQKGGVGKSTIAVNLAAVTADVLNRGDDPEASSPVLALSVDPQGSAVWWASRINALPFHIAQAHDDLAGLAALKNLPGIEHVYVDTPGWIDLNTNGDGADPLGSGPAADVLRAVLDMADQVIVPIETEPLSFDPTARTITKVLEPRGLRYLVVINNWDPRDGTYDLNQTRNFVKANGWPLANTVIRHYKLHARASAEGQVVTEYPLNRVALQAREDFYKFALELNVGGAR
ncbi:MULTISPECIES: ParA family protein [Mycolicibacterium]|jgi:chromosome partitioning protein|uniref:CobQ/CobB/MinD/ParA nucleotide binding domain-containing protein n=4 Tax=Mycobacteriaceae TaxID=1762 RepID=A0A6N4VFQ7_9MYCO|nr:MULTISPECIES: ParA family protein [Mycolicibacterium]MCK5754493.1 ParA family protein [Mycobacterium sp.]MEC9323727.1 ParA family protein [Actinomycetota bacterium]MCG7583472.1 ParA family protein [Mycolicibacterium sp. OfavD-34-C]MCV7059283.1 ParA family protein [Mycolicibacterium gilvum]MDZ4264974.1 ParA family protein [Mycobacterium sp.]